MPAGVALERESVRAALESAVRQAEVVHLHGLWQGHTRRGARAARQAGVPYVIVNGTVVVDDGRMGAARPGQVLTPR